MKRNSSLSLSAFAALAASLLLAGPASAAMNGMSTSNGQDATFVTQAAAGGMAEISEAHLAEKNGSGAKVKAFAQRMIADHTKADDQLMAIVKKDGFTAPSGIGPTNEAMMSKLQGMTGSSFDTAYLSGQIAGHEKMEALFKQEIASGKNPDLVAFAKNTLPVVEEHLALAKTDNGSSSSSM